MAPFLAPGGTITTIELDRERYDLACQVLPALTL